MNHLGEQISALVDGQLSPEQTEIALEHVMACEECARLLATERAFRRRLAEARDVRPSEDLTDRLVRLGEASVPPPPTGMRAVVERAREPFADAPSRRRLALRSSVVLGSAASILGLLVLVGAFYQRTGDPVAMLDEAAGPDQRPLQIMATTAPEPRAYGAPANVAGTDEGEEPAEADGTRAALTWLKENGWPAPERVPPHATINLVGTVESDGEEVVVVEFSRFGRTATVVEQRGVLDDEARSALERLDLDGLPVHRLPGPATTLVLESSGTTVLITSAEDPELVRTIAEAMPATEPGGGLVARLDDGWETVVEWTDVLLRTR